MILFISGILSILLAVYLISYHNSKIIAILLVFYFIIAVQYVAITPLIFNVKVLTKPIVITKSVTIEELIEKRNKAIIRAKYLQKNCRMGSGWFLERDIQNIKLFKIEDYKKVNKD